MTNPIEMAHQAIKTGMGFATAAALGGMSTGRLTEILRGRTQMAAHEAVGLSALAAIAAARLAAADADYQLLTNRNATL